MSSPITRAFGAARMTLLADAFTIAEHYVKNLGMRLTVRQLFYRLVASGKLDNSKQAYKKLIDTLSTARYQGLFPLDWLEDRGRNATAHADYHHYYDNVDSAMRGVRNDILNARNRYLWMSKWWGQQAIPAVWVEKEALSGVFDAPCRNLGVALFACKGYPSVSAMYQWLLSIAQAQDRHEALGVAPPTPVILYFGDHDPDGFEIPRAAINRHNRGLEAIQRVMKRDFDIVWERVALNMNQVQKYKAVPFQAKVSSSRYEKYIKEHGTDDAWELDALDPSVLQRLIRENVNAYYDADVHEHHMSYIEAAREEFDGRLAQMTVSEVLGLDGGEE